MQDTNMKQKNLEHFLELSILLTGFSRIELLGTGMLIDYYHQLINILGKNFHREFFERIEQVLKNVNNHPEDADLIMREELLSDPKHGPITRNIIKLWYLGQWEPLPKDWKNHYGGTVKSFEGTHIISSEAYIEGIVWSAIGAHPMGAKQPGFGTWSSPPKPFDENEE